ncbi:glutamate synthase central domain-containing protein [Allobaculum sp. Allo2]|uniref:glutamate synthase central domain-containing protein n=1 Tax=Allobaculum sp. Allo2 TaxID=2853432 RepID=UPI003463532E
MHLEDLKSRDRKPQMHEQKLRDELYRNFGYTYEDVNDQILPMAREAKEPIASMGTDVPLALLSKLHPTLFHYFKQLFAQVTNPPIDSLREKVVTDTTIYIGSSGNLLEEKAGNCALLEINHPILDASDMDKIRSLNQPGLKSRVISLLFTKECPQGRARSAVYRMRPGIPRRLFDSDSFRPGRGRKPYGDSESACGFGP